MSCIITYKGNKYTQEQFKEYISNNKKEFSHIIASNKNVIDSFKRKMEGIDYVFSQSPELASIGSKSQYLQYLSTIFPNSKVKDIVYHGSDTRLENFSIETFYDEMLDNPMLSQNEIDEINMAKSDAGFFFTSESKLANTYGNRIHSIKLNALNIKIVDAEKSNWDNIVDEETSLELGETFTQSTRSFANQYARKNINNKALIIKNVYDVGRYGEAFEILSDIYVVFDPSQIHILGSKQDIEGFKKFVNQNATNNLQSDISNLNLTEEVLNYFYENSSKSKDFTNFVVDLKRYVNLLQNVKTNEEIVELIKCL